MSIIYSPVTNPIKEVIKDKVNTAGLAGIAFRPWAMPENEHTWELLADLKERGFVYNTDYPDRLVKFFSKTSLEQESSLGPKKSFLYGCFIL